MDASYKSGRVFAFANNASNDAASVLNNTVFIAKAGNTEAGKAGSPTLNSPVLRF